MISLNKLRHFVALARTRSYVRAADELHLSQPALSRSIQSLEEDYDAVLFDRSRSGVYLTRVGQEVLEQAEALLYNANSLSDYLRKSSAGLLGSVSFSIGPQMSARILPTLVEDIVGRYPAVKLRVGSGTVANMQQQLLAGEIDFYIGHYDKSLFHDRIDIEHLLYGGPKFLVRPGHPLLKLETVTTKDMEPWPKVSGTAWNESLAGKIDRKTQAQLRASIEIDDAGIVANVARVTDTVLITSLGMTVPGLEPLPVQYDKKLERTPIGIHTLAERTLSPLVAAVIEGIRALTKPAE